MTAKPISELPDPFRFAGGSRVRTPEEWKRRRRELLDQILDIEYGRLPPVPARTEGIPLSLHVVKYLGDARHEQYRLTTGPSPSISFVLNLLIPKGDGPFPVILRGDGCWRDAREGIASEVLKRGYILAEFNRTEIVPDRVESVRRTGLRLVCPDGDYGALAAWAWGFHRCVDFLVTLEQVDAAHIAVTGHSRGGKTALLAGATDERIALTAPNNSGCGGAGCFRWPGPKCETMGVIVDKMGFWFSPRLKEFVGREAELLFDQHSLKALVAPRALLSTEALGDLWANPSGTWQSHLAAREAYRFLSVGEKIGIWYREGGHEHGLADWQALLDFADWQFRGKRPATRFDINPFPNLPPAFSWSAPVR